MDFYEYRINKLTDQVFSFSNSDFVICYLKVEEQVIHLDVYFPGFSKNSTWGENWLIDVMSGLKSTWYSPWYAFV